MGPQKNGHLTTDAVIVDPRDKQTKFIGPKGGVSDKGIEDDRLQVGVEVRLKVADNNRTLHEVHIPAKKGKE
jgi:hypothetical protein